MATTIPHVNQVCHKANRQLGFLYRNLKGCPKYFREYAYKQIVLPSIQYCSAIWDPYYQNAIHKVEMIQHRAARFILDKPWRRNERDQMISAKLANTSTLQEMYPINVAI